MFYKLDENKNAVPCSATEWGDQREEMRKTRSKHVAEDYINDKRISTVWLGLDHGFEFEDNKNYKPLIFETMIFEKGDEIYCNRYSTWKESEEGHKKAIQWVKDGCKDED
jgi:hypothetical protein